MLKANMSSSSNNQDNGVPTSITILPIDVEVPNFTVESKRTSNFHQMSSNLSVSVSTETGAKESSRPDAIPQFREILLNSRKTPYSREDFRDFLKMRMMEEALDCWINIKEYFSFFHAGVKYENIDKDAKIVLEMGPQSNVNEVAKKIANTYIVAGAPNEVNISESLRTEVTKRVENAGLDITIFDNVQKEVEMVMETNAYKGFIDIAYNKNISKIESFYRGILGFGLALITALGLAYLIYSEFEGKVTSHYYRLLFFPAILYANSCIQSYRTQVCVVCASNGVSSVFSNKSLIEAFKTGEVRTLVDTYAKEHLERISTQMNRMVLATSILITLIVFAIPPYNNFT